MKPTIQQQGSGIQITMNHEPVSRPQYGSASPKPKLGGGIGGTSSGARKPSLNAPAPSQSFRRPSISSITATDRANDFITGTSTTSASAIQRRRAPHLVQERIDHFTSINNMTNLSKSPASVLLSSSQKKKQQQQQLSNIRNSSISGDHILSPILAENVTDHQHQGGQGLHTHFMDEGETGFDVDPPHVQGDRDMDRGEDGDRGGDLDDIRNRNEEAINVNTTATAATTATVTATPNRTIDMQHPLHRPPPMTSMSFMSSVQPPQQPQQPQQQQRREEKPSAATRRSEVTTAVGDGGMATAHRHHHHTPASSSSSSSAAALLSSSSTAHNNTHNSSHLFFQQQQQQQQSSLPGSPLTIHPLTHPLTIHPLTHPLTHTL